MFLRYVPTCVTGPFISSDSCYGLLYLRLTYPSSVPWATLGYEKLFYVLFGVLQRPVSG